MRKMSGNRLSLELSSGIAWVSVLGRYLEMMKLHLCLYVSMSGIFGFVAASGTVSVQAIKLGAIILALACGSAVLNNIQDRHFDRFFQRTCNRSLASNKIPVRHAVILSGSLILSGFSGLFFVTGMIPFLWGLSALITYNLVYTPLKKQSVFAVIPGSVCGMSVPAIGWTAAGSPMNDPLVLIIMAISGLWQMAHYFIILLKNEKSGIGGVKIKKYPSFYQYYSPWEVRFLAMLWTSIYLLGMLMFLFYSAKAVNLSFFILFFNVFFCWGMVFFTLIRKKASTLPAFISINVSLLVFMAANIFDHLI